VTESTQCAVIHSDWLMDPEKAASVDPHVSGPLARRFTASAAHYIRLLRKRGELVARMDERLALVDVLALPTVPMLAPLIARHITDDRLWNRTDSLLLRNPQVANHFDLTSISLPIPGTSLPAGLMFFARHGEDHRLLRIAAAAMEALSAG
jgi:aspartyl-tRNA(Asn)/glutamyl-tRNA(Gln) amidotransferase subunit A